MHGSFLITTSSAGYLEAFDRQLLLAYPGIAQITHRLSRHSGRQIDGGEVIIDLDMSDVPALEFRLVGNGADGRVITLVSVCAPPTCNVNPPASPAAGDITLTVDLDGVPVTLRSPLVGRFNVQNIVAAAAAAHALGIEADAIADGVAALAGVPGRLERVPSSNGPLVLVDYAHTGDALEQGRLAAARRAEQHEAIGAENLEAHPVGGGD